MKNYNGKDHAKNVRRRDFDREYESEEQSGAVEPPLTDMDLLGSIYSIKDVFWNFKYSGRESHPGACLDVKEMNALLVHGTDSNSLIANNRYNNSYVIAPTAQNGLAKSTSFILDPYIMPVRKLLFYHIDRKIGCLDNEDVKTMRERMARAHPPDRWEGNP